jgi:hypothetical protein
VRELLRPAYLRRLATAVAAPGPWSQAYGTADDATYHAGP